MASPTEYTVATAEQALLERLCAEFLLQAYELGDDVDLAAERFDAAGVEDAARTICANPALRDLALSEHTEIHTGLGPDRPLFRLENGAGSAYYDDWEKSLNVDFPVGTVLVIHGDVVASLAPDSWDVVRFRNPFQRRVRHRRRERAYFRAEADKRRAADERPFAEYLDLLAEACGGDATAVEPTARDWRHWQDGRSVATVLQERRHAARRGLQGRRLDRRLGCGRPRTRAMARSSSRGGDSGDSSDDPEPARPGDRVADTSRTCPSLREGRA